ncbi:MAG: GtrA family protein [Patescibacteria group bacterium]
MKAPHKLRSGSNSRARQQLQREVYLYIAVGILGLVIDFACFFLAQNLGFSLIVAQWIGATVGFAHNHLWHHYKVFSHSERLTKTTTWSFIMSVVSIILSGPLLLGLNSLVDQVVINKILLLIVISLLQFLVRKYWIFKIRL